LLECADANSRSKTFECSFQLAQDELKRFDEQNEQHKQDFQQLIQSVDEQRALISELEIKLRVFIGIYRQIFIKKVFLF